MSYNFTPATGTYEREKLLAFLNTGSTAAPVWSLIGIRVEDSSLGYDWSNETKQDIVGRTYTTMKKPIISQTFDSWEMEGSDTAIKKIWEKAVVDQDYTGLTSCDMLICHVYAGFAERYSDCMVMPTALGGEGGGTLNMSVDVTYGGTRTVGTATFSNNVPTFVPEEAPTYSAATLTAAGFEYGVTYFTRSGSSSSSYVYTEVEAGATYASGTTYYTLYA